MSRATVRLKGSHLRKGHIPGVQNSASSKSLLLPIPSTLIIEDWISSSGRSVTESGGTFLLDSWAGAVHGIPVTATGDDRPQAFPEGVNGLVAIRFSGAQVLASAAGALNLSAIDAYEALVVGVRSSVTAASQYVYTAVGSSLDSGLNFGAGTNRAEAFLTNPTNDAEESDTSIPAALRVHNPRFDLAQAGSGEVSAFYDQALTQYDLKPSSGSHVDNFESSQLFIGNDSGGTAPLDGDIYRIALLHPLTAGQRKTCVDRLTQIYGTP